MARRKAELAPEAEGKVDLPLDSGVTREVSVNERCAMLEARCHALESTVSALIFSTFGARKADGTLFGRCRCGCFAVRSFTINHRVAGMISERVCELCEIASPLATKEVPRDEAEILEPADRVTAERINRGLIQARSWGGS